MAVHTINTTEKTIALVTSVDERGAEHSVGYVTAGITALADFQARGIRPLAHQKAIR